MNEKLVLKETFDLNYPLDSGFKKTQINFYSEKPNLELLYFQKDENGELLSNQQRLFVTDTNVAKLDFMQNFINLEEFKNQEKNSKNLLLILPAGEAYKNIESVLKIIRCALDHNFNRNCLFVGIGGGVITDMTSFAASIFKRGVDVEFVPTTLLADVDAALGGKTGCDFENYKNMIGSFYPAKTLNIWSDFIQTLPEKEFISGLAEAIKTAFLFSQDSCNLILKEKDKILKRNPQVLEKIILDCSRAKAKIVQEDFREKGNRAFLNLGHTFGHALEAVAGLGKITHGEAVAWGMARSFDLAYNLGKASKTYVDECKKILSDFGYDTNPQAQVLKNVSGSMEKLLSAMKKDKKNYSSAIRVILMTSPQKPLITEVKDEDILRVLC